MDRGDKGLYQHPQPELQRAPDATLTFEIHHCGVTDPEKSDVVSTTGLPPLVTV